MYFILRREVHQARAGRIAAADIPFASLQAK